MQVVEELHLARSERRLEVDVLHSCGELTCMDIDPPEEGAAYSNCKCAVHFLEAAGWPEVPSIHYFFLSLQ